MKSIVIVEGDSLDEVGREQIRCALIDGQGPNIVDLWESYMPTKKILRLEDQTITVRKVGFYPQTTRLKIYSLALLAGPLK